MSESRARRSTVVNATLPVFVEKPRPSTPGCQQTAEVPCDKHGDPTRRCRPRSRSVSSITPKLRKKLNPIVVAHNVDLSLDTNPHLTQRCPLAGKSRYMPSTWLAWSTCTTSLIHAGGAGVVVMTRMANTRREAMSHSCLRQRHYLLITLASPPKDAPEILLSVVFAFAISAEYSRRLGSGTQAITDSSTGLWSVGVGVAWFGGCPEVVVKVDGRQWATKAEDGVLEAEVNGAEPEGDGLSLPEPRIDRLASLRPQWDE
ncbi:hypothetical protein HGRIS_001615 [Hohenbuehelia grisea]|uniref:Uncharacterized protein n=1 Tax=Hohenbuehelia grisea TaxID=104357 RepID=A0ABR3JIY6_9AGAR